MLCKLMAFAMPEKDAEWPIRNVQWLRGDAGLAATLPAWARPGSPDANPASRRIVCVSVQTITCREGSAVRSRSVPA
jgi:hypothetical protein